MLNNSYYPKTNDSTIRKALIRKILQEDHPNDPDTVVVEELGLKHGISRVDIAVINGRMDGFELKSDLDTLFRLPKQMQTYNLILDQITLVVGKNHLHEAINLVPDWWGILIAKSVDSQGNVKFYNIREPENNPSPDNISIARLLWKDEALSILEKLGCASEVRYKRREYVYEKLASSLSLEDLRTNVRKYLSNRLISRAVK